MEFKACFVLALFKAYLHKTRQALDSIANKKAPACCWCFWLFGHPFCRKLVLNRALSDAFFDATAFKCGHVAHFLFLLIVGDLAILPANCNNDSRLWQVNIIQVRVKMEFSALRLGGKLALLLVK